MCLGLAVRGEIPLMGRHSVFSYSTEVHFKSHDQLCQDPSFFHAYQSLPETLSETTLETLLEIHFSTPQNNVQKR